MTKNRMYRLMVCGQSLNSVLCKRQPLMVLIIDHQKPIFCINLDLNDHTGSLSETHAGGKGIPARLFPPWPAKKGISFLAVTQFPSWRSTGNLFSPWLQ